MRWVTVHAGKLRIDSCVDAWNESSHLSPWNKGSSLPLGQIHELLFAETSGAPPVFLASALALQISKTGTVIWCDTTATHYPPALLEMCGGSPARLLMVRSRRAELVWTVAECLRCAGARAVIASLPDRLTRVEARRLQLAAEKGNTLGILMRSARSEVYAAATRWLITPMRGERSIQKWKAEFVHGHGWRMGQSFIVERHRHARPNHPETISVHSSSTLADREKAATTSRVSA